MMLERKAGSVGVAPINAAMPLEVGLGSDLKETELIKLQLFPNC